MNSVVLTGNLTKNVETKIVNNGTSTIATFTIAWNRGDTAGYFDCIAFDKKAELIQNYCKKGSKILIRGELSQDRWKAQDGTNKSAIRIIVAEVEFLSKKEQENAPESQNEPVEDKSVEPGDLPF